MFGCLRETPGAKLLEVGEEAVVEKFNDMPEDLDKERTFMARQWSKRETQIVSVIDSVSTFP